MEAFQTHVRIFAAWRSRDSAMQKKPLAIGNPELAKFVSWFDALTTNGPMNPIPAVATRTRKSSYATT